ncbi:MAG: Ig-like domain-containing protein [Acidimicrobiales bacterium]
MPTTVAIDPASVAFTAINETRQLTATVFDQRGNAMAGSGIAWSTTDAAVVTVNQGGLATAAGSGTAQVRATAGTAVGTAPASVTQTPAQLVKLSGDTQTRTVAQQLPAPLIVQVKDAGGAAIAGIVVDFSVVQGNGALAAARDTTLGDGQASTLWTLGTSTTSGQQVTVSLVGGSLTPVMFTATAMPGPADTVAVEAGDGQTGPAATALALDPTVVVRDSFGNARPGAVVTFAITGGGGLVSTSQDTTGSDGTASVDWTLGNPGSNALRATAAGSGIGGNPVDFTATATPPGPPASVTILEGDNQTGLESFALNVAPAVIVRDASNHPVGGAQVDFVASGGGSVTGSPVSASTFGIARLGSWIVEVGANTLTATAGAASATFTATGVTAEFNIDVRPLTALSGSQQAAFDDAASTWQALIYGDLPDVDLTGPNSVPPGQCGSNAPAVNEVVDDVIIFATVEVIDGPGGVLGSAGPCWIRDAGFLTIAGRMRFDSADVAALESSGRLPAVILHEMGHVLGFGTLWGASQFGLLSEPASLGGPDPHFTGTRALAAFDDIGGTGYTAGKKVPVENTGGPGTADGHWRESVFGGELMTGWLNPGMNPISVVSLAAMGDEGYTVNHAGADAYSLSFLQLLGAAGPALRFKDDIIKGPVLVVDRGGRVVRVTRP